MSKFKVGDCVTLTHRDHSRFPASGTIRSVMLASEDKPGPASQQVSPGGSCYVVAVDGNKGIFMAHDNQLAGQTAIPATPESTQE